MASPPLVTITGMVYEVDGVTPFNGAIEFVQPVTLRHNDGTVILSGTLTATVLNGVLSRQIYACDAEGWGPADWTWEVRMRAGSGWRTFTLLASVDDTDGVNLGDIVASDTPPSSGVAYAPINHTHADLGGGGGSGAVDSVNGRTGVVVLTKADVGLSSVDNTSDAGKPVSTATQTALNLKAPLASPAFTGTPTGITKAHVGLGSVDNTSDAAKPISTATASALAAKADLVGGVIPSSQIPAVALVEYLGTAANQAAMLAKVGQPGDWVNRTDTGTTWQLTGSNPAVIGSWTEMLYPASPVQSVAGKTGAVTLAKADVGLGNVDNTADSAKTFTASQISNSTAVGRSVVTAADAAAARTAIGAGTSSLALGTTSTTALAGDALATHVAASDPHTQYARIYAWNGSAYVLSTTGDVYIGPSANDPGTLPDGSIWVKTT